MHQSWQAAHLRGQQSVGVWETWNAAFAVQGRTLAQHKTDLDLLLTQAQQVRDQEAVADAAATARDNNYNTLHDIATRMPSYLEAQLTADSLRKKELSRVFDVRPDSLRGLTERCRRLLTLWINVNADRAAAVPPLPALDLDGVLVAVFQAKFNGHDELVQAEITVSALAVKLDETLIVTEKRAHDLNTDWYQAWGNYYAAGSPQKAALSQVDTGPVTQPPTPLEIATLTQSGLSVQVAYVPGGGKHATTLLLLWQVDGVDPGFDHSTPVLFAGQTVGPYVVGQTVNFKTRGANSINPSVESPVVTIVIA